MKITAKEARKLTLSHNNNDFEKAINRIMDIIAKSAKTGFSKQTIGIIIQERKYSTKIKDTLETEGFTVSIVQDRRDGDYFDISW